VEVRSHSWLCDFRDDRFEVHGLILICAASSKAAACLRQAGKIAALQIAARLSAGPFSF